MNAKNWFYSQSFHQGAQAPAVEPVRNGGGLIRGADGIWRSEPTPVKSCAGCYWYGLTPANDPDCSLTPPVPTCTQDRWPLFSPVPSCSKVEEYAAACPSFDAIQRADWNRGH